MKKISSVLVSLALFGVVALNSCKQKPAEAPVEESTIIEEAPAIIDTVAADSAVVIQ